MHAGITARSCCRLLQCYCGCLASSCHPAPGLLTLHWPGVYTGLQAWHLPGEVARCPCKRWSSMQLPPTVPCAPPTCFDQELRSPCNARTRFAKRLHSASIALLRALGVGVNMAAAAAPLASKATAPPPDDEGATPTSTEGQPSDCRSCTWQGRDGS